MDTDRSKTLAVIAQGEPVILRDDATSSSNFFILASGSSITSETICFIAGHARGVICAAVDEARYRSLGLPLMPKRGGAALDLTVSVEARYHVTTGISAADRAETIRTLALTADPKLDLVMPGHIFPLVAKRGGVLVRLGPAEAATDLLALAGVPSVGALCQCLNSQGQLLSEAEAQELKRQTGLPLIGISDVVGIRLAEERVIERVAAAQLPTSETGEFKAVCYRSLVDNAEHLALVKGEISGTDNEVLARVHAEHCLGDLLGAGSLPSRELISVALRQVARNGSGVFVYVRHPHRGLLQETVADLARHQTAEKITASRIREYGIGSQILSDLGVRKIALLSNSKWDIPAISAFNLEIASRVSLEF